MYLLCLRWHVLRAYCAFAEKQAVCIYTAEVNNHKLKYFKVAFPGLHSVSAVVTGTVLLTVMLISVLIS